MVDLRAPEEKVMDLPEEITDDLRKRLRRIAGQVQGIERMPDEGRECRDMAPRSPRPTGLTAAHAAVRT
jgi:hypothetical protein